MMTLDRFRRAQDSDGTYDRAVAELRAGRKTSHWMWFVFPQLEGLGRSETARYYAITSMDEARDYLADDVLGARLRECARLAAAADAPSADVVFGGIDAVKLRSSMTLFASAADDADDTALFTGVLDRWFDGRPDPETLRLLGLDQPG